VVRVAGNTLGSDVRGSLNYALEHLGESLKLVSCSATAVAGRHCSSRCFLDPTTYLSLVSKHAVRMLVDRLQVVVHAAARSLEAALGPSVSHHPR